MARTTDLSHGMLEPGQSLPPEPFSLVSFRRFAWRNLPLIRRLGLSGRAQKIEPMPGQSRKMQGQEL
jgi:hypothetical protein